MDLAQIRTFVTVAREGNLTRCAQLLHLTQPALSLHLKKLQAELGLALFERTPRGMRLTQAGVQLLQAAERALSATIELRAAAAALTGTVSGALRIGTIVDPEFLRLGAFLRRLVEHHPGLTTGLTHGKSGHVRGEVEAGRLDVAVFQGATLSRNDYERINGLGRLLQPMGTEMLRLEQGGDWNPWPRLHRQPV